MTFRHGIHTLLILALAGAAGATSVLQQVETELTSLLADVSPNIVTVRSDYGRAETHQTGLLFSRSGYVLLSLIHI